MTTLAEHYAKMPRPFNPFTPEAIAWQATLQQLLDERDAQALELIPISPDADIRPVVSGKGPKPAWSGITKDYMAQKKRESRARATEAKKCHDCAEMAVEGRSRCEKCLLRTANARNKKRGVVLDRSERLVLIREGLAQRKEVAA